MYKSYLQPLITAVSISCAAFVVQAENLSTTLIAPNDSTLVTPSTEVLTNVEEANTSAIAFINSQRDRYPIWQTAQVSKIVSLYNLQGVLQGYEVQLKSTNSQPVGYLILEANLNKSTVAEFTAKGEAPSTSLIKEFNAKTGLTVDTSSTDIQLLWNGPGTSALTWANQQNGIELIALNPTLRLEDYHLSGKYQNTSTADLKKPQRYRRAVTEKSEGEAIDWGFTPFYQEDRFWSESSNDRHECYAGCTPVAAAMLIDFYDRNGFPFMIGDDSQQIHHASTPLMRDTINQLRGFLGTYCREDGQGGTPQRNSTKIVDYMNSRGTEQWKARRITYASLTTFTYLMNEIKAKRPAMVHYHSRGNIGTNHSAIAYGYIYGGYWSDNFLTVRTGWSSQKEIQYNIKSMGTIEATLVSKK